MDDLVIERTNETPEINFNASSGMLKIKGRAYSNDIGVFYKKMSFWLEEYLKSPSETTTIELQLEYYNSVFIKLLFYFIEKSKEVQLQKKGLVIKWYYHDGDDESEEDAMRISKIISFPIERIQID